MKKMATLALALVLAACGNKGSDFEGHWVEVGNGRNLMSIERNNSEYLVHLTDTKRPNDPDVPIPAVLKDGKLVMDRLGSPSITYVKDKDIAVVSSMMGGLSFQRAKK